MRNPLLLLMAGLALAGASGFLTSQALSGGSSAAARTETITLTNGGPGPTGPAGPRGARGPVGVTGERGVTGEPGATGPQGPAGQGGVPCPDGFSPGFLVINHPGGHVTLYSCLEDLP